MHSESRAVLLDHLTSGARGCTFNSTEKWNKKTTKAKAFKLATSAQGRAAGGHGMIVPTVLQALLRRGGSCMRCSCARRGSAPRIFCRGVAMRCPSSSTAKDTAGLGVMTFLFSKLFSRLAKQQCSHARQCIAQAAVHNSRKEKMLGGWPA